eukprot:CAMPEP_0172484290 /NCGR_PEP_ID=MMETSP1066-20121228/11694_1 /TAXON_ID=671091 /ORGANISM="Coscinodiscus wailesii, Strain CCMP2513" /LENGTH=45 /DNA_ID= /DNA_START= /DNA_END= /DNA_ORIENTATION=
MTNERVEALNNIGFEWDRRAYGFVRDDVKWQERYEELKTFKARTG